MPLSETIFPGLVLLTAVGCWIAYRRFKKLQGDKGTMEVRFEDLGWEERDLFPGDTVSGSVAVTARETIEVQSVAVTLVAQRSGLATGGMGAARRQDQPLFENRVIVATDLVIPAGTSKSISVAIQLPAVDELKKGRLESLFKGLDIWGDIHWSIKTKVDTPGWIDFYDEQTVRVVGMNNNEHRHIA